MKNKQLDRIHRQKMRHCESCKLVSKDWYCAKLGIIVEAGFGCVYWRGRDEKKAK